jgi:hypothetical protein
MNNNQDLSARSSAMPHAQPQDGRSAKRSADFNIDELMENYKEVVDRQIDRVSAKFNRNRNPKDGAESLKLLDQMVETLLMHKPFRERSRRHPPREGTQPTVADGGISSGLRPAVAEMLNSKV